MPTSSVPLVRLVSSSARAPARLVRLIWAALMRYLQAGGMHQGAAVAFYAALSIAPLLVLVANVLIWFLGDDAAQGALVDSVSRLVGDQEAHTLARMLARRDNNGVATVGMPFGSGIALVTTTIGAAGVFVELRAALHAMLGEPARAHGLWPLVRLRLLAIGVVLGSGLLLSLGLLAQTASLIGLRWLGAQWPILAPLLGVAETLWAWAVITLLFALIICWLPAKHLPMRHAVVGASVASVLFVLGRSAISFYLATMATRSTLGAAASFAALLVWVYWSSQMFLIGASIAVELGADDASRAIAIARRLRKTS